MGPFPSCLAFQQAIDVLHNLYIFLNMWEYEIYITLKICVLSKALFNGYSSLIKYYKTLNKKKIQ